MNSGTAERAAVSLREVTRRYRRSGVTVVALDRVSASFAAGSFTAVMGPSGSGKSTLLQCASGLDRPDAGGVVIDGFDLGGLSEVERTRLRRDRVGFVFQGFNLLPSLTAAQNVELPFWLAGRRARRSEVRDALTAVGLDDRLRHRPAELSGGEQQRVAIARALIGRPAVVFADEPTGALDSVNAAQLLDLLSLLSQRDGRTIVLVTHDPVAAARAERVLFLAGGRIVGSLHRPGAERIAGAMAELTRDAVELAGV
jgi:putative ABC transport system ATP-binding protein